ncbi:MAG: YegP family protein [Streptosporangiaceae bacterium]
MAGKFVLKKGTSGKFHFKLVAANGQAIATSQAYEHKHSALEGIESVRQNAPDATVHDETEE